MTRSGLGARAPKPMIVCSCLTISSSRIEALVADGATSVEAVTRACGAGSDCGSCRAQIAQLVAGGAASERSDGSPKRHLRCVATRAA